MDSSAVMTRGAGATASAGANSFRTTGFQSNGLNVANTDYFQVTLSASPGYTLSITSVTGQFAGTATFFASPGVADQWAYSLDGSSFTMIGSSNVSTSTTRAWDFSGVSALQNVVAGTTVTLRYYASGRTSTGGWGFNSPSDNSYGLAIQGLLDSAASPPSVTTVAASATNTTTATVNGDVTADGGSTVTNRGAVYKTTAGVAITDNKTQSGTGTGAYSVNLSSLSVNQQYFFKAYAQNVNGTTLGDELSFTTLANTPGATTVNNPTVNSLDVTLAVNGNPAATEFAIQATNNSLYVQSDGTLGASPAWQTAAAWGTKTVTGLIQSQTYGFAAKARNGENVETAFGAVGNGTTDAGVAEPSVSLPTASAIGSTTATLGGTIDSTNGAPVVERGVYWHTSTGFTPPGTGTKASQSGTFGNGAFTVSASGLPPGSTVYFVAFASNSAGAGYSSESSFLTIPAAPAANAATLVTNVSFSANWTAATGATNYLLDAATAADFSAFVSGYNNRIVGDVTTFSVTGLSPNVAYYYRVRAQNAAGTSGSSTTTSVTTVTMLASVTTTPASAIAPTSASSGGNVTDNGGATVTARGVCWNTTGSPTRADDFTTDGSGNGVFTSSLTGLVPGETYHVRAYAVNSLGTNYGNEISFSATCFTNVVTGLNATGIDTTEFTANWSPLAGATGYRLDVAEDLGVATPAVITRFDFTTGPHLVPGTVNAAVTSSVLSLSTGSIETNLTSDGNFPNSPYVEETGGWNVNNVAAAKYFTFTVVPVNGYAITVTGITFRALATAAGPSAFSYNIGGGLSTGTSNAPSGAPVVFNNAVTGVVGHASALEIRILGWTNGTRTTSGGGAFRLDELQISGFVSPPVDYMPGYSNRAVAGVSQVVTGLAEGASYQFRVRAEGAAGCVSLNSATVTVDTVANSPFVSFGATSSTVSEAVGTVTIPVTLSMSAHATVQVALASSSTASLGSDLNFATTNIVFTDGGPLTSNVVITVVDDSLVENTETAVVQIVGGLNVIPTAPTNYTLVITDNEPSVQFTSSSAGVMENAGSYTVTVYKSSILNDVSGQVVLGGSASIGGDYSVNTTNFTLNGVVTSATFVVSIVDDGDVEADETVTLTLNQISGATTGTPAVFTLTISSDDCEISDTIAFQGFEGDFCDTWSITGGAARISNLTGTGDSPANGRIRTGAYSWQVNNATDSLYLTNVSLAAHHSVTVTVRVAANGTSANGMEATDRVQISVALNNDPFPATPDITINGSPNNNARWGYDATSVVTTLAGVPVSVTSANASATWSITNVATANIIIPDGYQSVRLRITANNNAASEIWSIDDVQLAGVAGAYVDTVAPQFTSFQVPATNDGMLAAGFSITGTVQDAFSGLTVNGATPYIFILDPNGGIVVASNTFDTAPTHGSFQLSTLIEAVAPVPPSSIVLGAYTATVGAVDLLGNAMVTNFTFVIADDDIFPPVLQGFSPNGDVFIEDTFPGGIVITGQVRDSNSGLLAITNDPAIAPRINLYSPGGVQVLTNAVFTTGPLTNGAYRDSFFFGSLVYTASAALFTEYGVYTTVVSVTDADLDRPGDSLTATTTFTFSVSSAIVQFGSTLSSIPENGGMTSIAIIVSSPVDATVRVAIAGTATPGPANDFTNTTTNIVFQASGSTTQFITIVAVDDLLEEGNETVELTLTSASGVSISSPSTHTVTILDDECFPRIAFQGFEGDSCDTWAITNGVTGSTATGVSDTPLNQRILNGVRSWQVNNTTATLDLAPVTISSYQSVTSTVRLSASSTSGGGLDSGDNVRIFISLNNAPYSGTPDIQIDGFGNTNWGYGATRTAATTAGVGIVVSANPNGVATATIAIPDGYATVRMRIIAMNNAADEFWNIDDIALDGVPGAGDVNGPVFSGVNLNGLVTNDAGMAAGFAVTGLVADTISGVVSNSDTPYYFIRNSAGGIAVASNGFAVAPVHGGALLPTRVADTFAGVAPADITIGIYTATLGAVDTAGTPNVTVTNYTFTVVDDDDAAPVLSGFAVHGQSFTIGSSIAVTGRVQDAGSGVFSITNLVTLAPRINLYGPDGAHLLTNAVFTNGPSSDGSARLAASNLAYTIAPAATPIVGVYTAQVSVTDYDQDRVGDSLTTTSNVVFTLLAPNVSFGSSYAVVPEGGSTTIAVTLAFAYDATVRVAIAGTATPGITLDYTNSTTNLVFTSMGSPTQWLTVVVNDDLIAEDNETIIFTLASASGATIVGAQSTSVVVIADNDCASGSIAFQGFESSLCDTWAITNGEVGSASTGTTDTPANSRVRTGLYSWQVVGTSRTLDLAHLAVGDYSAVTISVRIASTSTNASNGADAGDSVSFYISTNGAPYPVTPDLRISGNSNARWDYNATLTATATAGSPVTVSAPQSGASANNYSLANLVIANGSTSVALRIVAVNDSALEVWNIDDIRAVGSLIAPPAAPVATAGTAGNLTSFQANWNASSGATGYRLDVATDIGFSGFVAGFNNAAVGNSTFASVGGLTAGQTYYYRVRATNSAGASPNSSIIAVTLPATDTVDITDLPPLNSTTGTVSFTATDGALYDVYYSDSDLSGVTNWTYYASVTATDAVMTVNVPEDDRRYFKVVIAGAAPNSSPSPVWGVIKPTIPSGYSMYSAPLALEDLEIDGEFGDALKAGLANGSQLLFLEPGGNWAIITLAGGNWDQPYTVAEGQGFFIVNAGAPYVPRFAGPVGNTGAATRTINPAATPTTGRWNILGLQQGKTRSFTSLFATGNFTGVPTGNWNANFADVIAIDLGGGVFKRVFRAGDGTWRDSSTLGVYNTNLQPGAAVYYFRYGNNSLDITF